MSIGLSGNQFLIGSKEAAHVFDFNPNSSSWNQGIKIVPSDNMPSDGFGSSVALDGNKALIGASQDDSNGNSAGSVYTYIKNSNTITNQLIKI